MKLSRIINIWCLMTIMLMVFGLYDSLSDSSQIRWGVFAINLFLLFVFYVLIGLASYKKNYRFWNNLNLFITVFFSSFFILIILKIYYYHISGEFFEFSAKDTLEYDSQAKWLINYGIFESIGVFFRSDIQTADFGANYITSLAYRIYPSTIVFNFLNVIIGSVTVVLIYNFSRRFLVNRLAFLTALIYGLSSFTVYLYSTGMKETFFVFFVVLFFESLAKFWLDKKWYGLIVAFISIAAIYFFRPAVMFMILLSVGLGLVIHQKKFSLLIFIAIPLLLVGLIYYEEIIFLKEAYLSSKDVIEYRSGLKASNFNYIAAFVSGILGPLPTYAPLVEREQQAFYSIGLGFKVLISVLFLLGISRVLKNNEFVLILYSFVIIEVISLTLILESFELRLNSPHVPFVYILGMMYVQNIQIRKRKFFEKKIALQLYLLLAMLMIVVWNFRI